MTHSVTRPQTVAVVSAALIAALLGLALLVTLIALHADQALANMALAAMHGQMRLADLADAIAGGGPIVQRYLVK